MAKESKVLNAGTQYECVVEKVTPKTVLKAKRFKFKSSGLFITSFSGPPKKRYNAEDHQAAIQARLDGVAVLDALGYSIKAIGYAFHKTPDWARAKLAKFNYQQAREKSG